MSAAAVQQEVSTVWPAVSAVCNLFQILSANVLLNKLLCCGLTGDV